MNRLMLIRLRSKGVGKKFLSGQSCQRSKVALGRIHHDRGAAGIDLVAGQIGKIFQHRAVDKSGTALPGIFRQMAVINQCEPLFSKFID